MQHNINFDNAEMQIMLTYYWIQHLDYCILVLDLDKLTKLTNLVLFFGKNNISNIGVSYLAQALTKLTELHLELVSNNIGDIGT
jgi:hypothetical protein